MEKFKTLLRKIDNAIVNKIVGLKPYRRDLPDPRPPNPARERMKKAEIFAKISSKDSALELIKRARSNYSADFEFNAGFWEEISLEAINRARGAGATEEEIRKALHEGNMLGAELRAGLDR